MSSAYCAQSDIEYVLTRFGLAAFLNDDNADAPVQTAQLNSAITWASVRIDFYLRMRYAAAQLNGNDYVRIACSVIAAMQIVRRKQGAHAGLQAEYDEIEKQLDDIQHFKAEVPDSYPISEPGIWHSNVRIDQSFWNRKVRTSMATSSNEQTSQKTRFGDRFDIILEP